MTNPTSVVPAMLPAVNTWDRSFGDSTHLIVTGGFEDVCGALLAFLPPAPQSRIRSVLVIQYLPRIERNEERLAQSLERLHQLGYSESLEFMTFDRMQPTGFRSSLASWMKRVPSDARLCFDISGMSRLLLLGFLESAVAAHLPCMLVQGVAEVYEPTREAYLAAKQDYERTGIRPEFLCRDISQSIVLPDFGGLHDIAFPTTLVAFAEFNYKRLARIVADGHYTQVVLVVPSDVPREDEWRTAAIQEINNGITTAPTQIERMPPTDYVDTVAHLEALYRNLRYSSNVAIAPLGTKLQTVACWVLHHAHPDVQIVFTAPVSFNVDLYTRGVRDFLSVHWSDIDQVDRACAILNNPQRAAFERIIRDQ